MKHLNEDAFLADFAATPWDTAFIFHDINDICAYWSKLYNDTVEKHAPLIKKRVPSNQLTWINLKIKKAVRLGNKLSCTKNIVAILLMTHGTTTGFKGT